MTLARISRWLTKELRSLSFSEPVAAVYNPLDYAREPHENYLSRYGNGNKEVVFLGMNPGPWGMAQTGVPFGHVGLVKEWLAVEGKVGRPAQEHPKRPVTGFSCTRGEVSGARFWGWARDCFGTAEAFHERFFVANYCPLIFLEASGRNRTPDKLPVAERDALLSRCDEGLRRLIRLLEPRLVVGVGAFAEKRAQQALAGMDVDVGRVLHPSPASPKANSGWAGIAMNELRALGVELPDDLPAHESN